MSRDERLPRNFHRTFKPERHYLSAMLQYAASNREGDYQAIGSATGIPTGASSGKAPAILDYCRGMGLVRLAKKDRSAVKKPELTQFGRIVLLEDAFLKTGISQWIAHLNLCSPKSGADVWCQTFFTGTAALGVNFERDQLEAYLGLTYGLDRGGLIGPMIGMYEDDAAFRVCGALTETSGRIQRRPAPLSEEFGFAYGALLLQQMSDHFPGARQISVTELDAVAGWRTIPGWDIASHQRVLELVERKGVIEVDRHMEPWLLRPAADADSTWKRLYDDLL
jgi:hypothetical protein